MAAPRCPVLLLVVSLLVPAPLLAQRGQPPQKPPVKTTPKAPAKKAPGAPAKPADKPAPVAPPPPPDLEVRASYVCGDKTTNGSVLMHAARQRVDYESGLASIQQCDAGRALQVNSATRTYLEMPYQANVPAPPVAAGKQKGGEVTYTTTIVDTGEKKEMFGFTARHVKTTVAKQTSATACDKTPEQVEMDGWYIDLPSTVTCAGAPPVQSEIRVDPKDASCRDKVTYVRPAAPAGYPLSYTMTTTSGTDAPSVTKMEATGVKRLTADAQQFEVPADYIPVKTPSQLTADHRPGEEGPKKPGTVRIGIARMANTSGAPASVADLTEALMESFSQTETDVVLLRSDKPAEIEAEAKTRSCDYILTNTLAEMKQPGKGMLGKIAGTSPEGFSAKVEFSLLVPGLAKPAFASSEKSGTSMLQTAVGAAKRISQFITPMMLARYGYMKAFTAMSGNAGPGMMQQTPDPVVSSMFSLIDRATGAKNQQLLTSEDAAAAAALMKEIESVTDHLKKRKS